MTSEIKERLQNTSEVCIKTFEAWDEDRKNSDAREALQEAIHELRKVTSRLEIELAVNERDQMAQKPIPIPPHRAARNKGRNANHDDEVMGNNNDAERKGPKVQRKRAPRGKPAAGNA